MKTVIAINANNKGSLSKNRNTMDYGKELREVIELTEKAKRKLADLTLSMDTHDLDTGSLDEALDALDDAIDIMEDTDLPLISDHGSPSRL